MKWTKLDSIASTNSHISALIQDGQGNDDLVITTDYQESGRGQGAHSWHSQKGKNLLMSLLLHPAFLSASEQFQLSRLTSLAICDTLEPEGIEPVIKWPNDILTNRGKIAGILIELRIVGGNISHTIIGIGLNLNQSVFPAFPVSATSLTLENGNIMDPNGIAETLIEKILSRYNLLKAGNGEVLEKEYLERLYMIDKPALFLVEGNEYPGLIRGVTKIGELQVEIDGEIKTFGHQEISVKVERGKV